MKTDFLFFQQKIVKHFHTALFSVCQCHSAVGGLCHAATIKAFLGGPSGIFPIERVFSSAEGTEQLNRSCQNASLYIYLAMHEVAIALTFIYTYSETVLCF